MDAVLLYGATGYSGRLIAERAQQRWQAGKLRRRLILAGRTGQSLQALARGLGVDYRTFAVGDPRAVDSALQGVGVVINAAGPFAHTAEPLAKAALRSGCHYIDINGEVDVYKRLDDLGHFASQRGLTMVCGAGHSAMASDLLLEGALRYLETTDWGQQTPRELGAVRIALSSVDRPSRGSVQTALRTVREQVLVVRGSGRVVRAAAPRTSDLVLTYVPLGQLERVFDFGSRDGDAPSARRQPRPLPARRVASAVNLIDTLTARLTVARHVARVRRIESYLEASETLRTTHQLAALGAPFIWIPALREIARRNVALLPEGPTPEERRRAHLSVVLEVEDLFGQTLINWRLETPSAYDFTACAAVAVAERICRAATADATSSSTGSMPGWRTPGEFMVDGPQMIDPCTGRNLQPIGRQTPQQSEHEAQRRGCRLDARVSASAGTVPR